MRAVHSHRRGVLKVQDHLHKLEEARAVLTDQEQRKQFDRLREVFVLSPRRVRVEEETSKPRRKGRLRRSYSRKVAEDSRRIGEVCVAENGAMTRILTLQATASGAGAVRMRRASSFRQLAWFVMGVGAGALFLYLLQRGGQL